MVGWIGWDGYGEDDRKMAGSRWEDGGGMMGGKWGDSGRTVGRWWEKFFMQEWEGLPSPAPPPQSRALKEDSG